MEFVGEEDIIRHTYQDLHGEVHEETDEEAAERIYELAVSCREEAAASYEENEFRYVSRLQKDNNHSYWYEIDVTDAGERARKCWQRRQCCDEHGNLHIEGTIDLWQVQLERYDITRFYFAPPHFTFDSTLDAWINEPWAATFRRCMELRCQGVETNHQAVPLYTLTKEKWARWLQGQNETMLVDKREELFRLDDSWAQFIHDAVMVAMMKSNDVALV
jgi:hypothetical protein